MVQSNIPKIPSFLRARRIDAELQLQSEGATIVDKQQENSLWIHCPICGGKTRTKVYADTVLVKFPLYCPKCHKEIRIDVVKLKMIPSEMSQTQ